MGAECGEDGIALEIEAAGDVERAVREGREFTEGFCKRDMNRERLAECGEVRVLENGAALPL